MTEVGQNSAILPIDANLYERKYVFCVVFGSKRSLVRIQSPRPLYLHRITRQSQIAREYNAMPSIAIKRQGKTSTDGVGRPLFGHFLGLKTRLISALKAGRLAELSFNSIKTLQRKQRWICVGGTRTWQELTSKSVGGRIRVAQRFCFR